MPVQKPPGQWFGSDAETSSIVRPDQWRSSDPRIKKFLQRFISMTDSSVKTALVTGSSRGIGRATALALARDGARVIVHYGNSKAEAEKVVEEIRSARGKADAVQ